MPSNDDSLSTSAMDLLFIRITSSFRSTQLVHGMQSHDRVRTIRTLDYSYPRLFVPYIDYSYCRPFVPWTVRTLDRSYNRQYLCTMDYSAPRSFVPNVDHSYHGLSVYVQKSRKRLGKTWTCQLLHEAATYRSTIAWLTTRTLIGHELARYKHQHDTEHHSSCTDQRRRVIGQYNVVHICNRQVGEFQDCKSYFY